VQPNTIFTSTTRAQDDNKAVKAASMQPGAIFTPVAPKTTMAATARGLPVCSPAPSLFLWHQVCRRRASWGHDDTQPLPNILIMSARPWRLDIKLHPLDTFHGWQRRTGQQVKRQASHDAPN
jgi:hypothetical protein